MKAYIPAREASLLRLIEIKDKIGMDGLDLLWHLLELNPNKRVSAELAIQHPFFDSVRQVNDPTRFDMSIMPLVHDY